MSVKFLPLLTVTLMVAGCNRQHSQQAATTTTPAQVATPGAGRDPEPVERVSPTAPVLPPISARVVDEPPQHFKTRAKGAETGHHAEAVIPASTRIRVRLGDSLNSKTNRTGERFSAYLDEPIVSGNRVIIPKGTLFRGHVVEAQSSGRLRGRAYLGVTLDSFRLHGMTYAIATRAEARASNSHNKRNAVAIGGGSGAGATIGAVAGGGVGALIGAGAGAAAGTTGAFITGRKNVELPVETPLVFSLRSAITVRV